MELFRIIAKPLTPALTLCMLWLGLYIPAAQAAMVSTQSIVNAAQVKHEREHLRSLYQRKDVMAALEKYGVDPKDAQARVASLTDQEVHAITGKLDQQPAGAGALEVVLIAFLVLVITDLLGYTDVFTFVHPVR